MNINELVKYHKTEKRAATLTAVQPPRDLVHYLLKEAVLSFQEKPIEMVSGLMEDFVLENQVLDLITEILVFGKRNLWKS